MNMFTHILMREWTVYKRRIPYVVLTDCGLRVLFFGMVHGYLLPATGMPQGYGPSGMLYIGTFIFGLFSMVIAFSQELLTDYESDRHYDYLVMQSSAHTVFCAKLLFCTLILWFLSIGNFIFAKLLLSHWLDTTHLSLVPLIIMLGIASYTVSAITLLCYASLTSVVQVRMFWRRILVPLTFLGGYLAPWEIVYKVFPALGIAMYFNPIVYILEGLRMAVFGPVTTLLYLYIILLGAVGCLCALVGIHAWRAKLDSL